LAYQQACDELQKFKESASKKLKIKELEALDRKSLVGLSSYSSQKIQIINSEAAKLPKNHRQKLIEKIRKETKIGNLL